MCSIHIFEQIYVYAYIQVKEMLTRKLMYVVVLEIIESLEDKVFLTVAGL